MDNYQEEFLEGIEAVAKQPYWRQERWWIDCDEIASILTSWLWPVWIRSDHSNNPQERKHSAVQLAHRSRSRLIKHLNRHYGKMEVYSASDR